MSLTDAEHKETLAAQFFTEIIVPLADTIRAKGKAFFPLGPDPQQESYYDEPTRRIMAPEDFEFSGDRSVEEFMTSLAAFWRQEGNSELAKIIPKLTELALQLSHEEEQDEDVSPFIYVMF
jgi:hypothetical protein